MVTLNQILIYSLYVGAVALTVTKSALLDSIHEELDRRKDKGSGWKKIHQLFNCPFCFSFWVSLSLMAFCPFGGVESLPDRLFYSFVLMGGGSLVAGAIYYMLKYALTEPGGDA